jgi:hypothetical protein
MDAEALTRLQAQRLAFLRAVYDASQERTNAGIRFREIGEQLGFDEGLADAIADYLVGEGLIEWHTFGHLAITHWGIVEIERGIATPTEKTEHFPSLVIAGSYVQVGSMVGSGIQQNVTGSNQAIGEQPDVQAMRHLVDALREAVIGVQLDNAKRLELDAELSTLDIQLASPKPKFLRESVESLRRILEGVVASGTAPQVVELLRELAHTAGI